MNLLRSSLTAVASIGLLSFVSACSDDAGSPAGSGNTGGGTSTGATNGQNTGGTETGGATSSGGGTSTGGASTGAGTGGGTGGLGTGGSDVGSGGNGGDVEIEPTFETLKYVMSGYRPDINCAASDCHSGGHEHGGHPLRLIDDEQLYTVLTSYVSIACDSSPVVKPWEPEDSALVKVLKGSCGEQGTNLYVKRMPDGCFEDEWENNCVADEYIAAIEEWIARGAPEHED